MVLCSVVRVAPAVLNPRLLGAPLVIWPRTCPNPRKWFCFQGVVCTPKLRGHQRRQLVHQRAPKDHDPEGCGGHVLSVRANHQFPGPCGSDHRYSRRPGTGLGFPPGQETAYCWVFSGFSYSQDRQNQGEKILTFTDEAEGIQRSPGIRLLIYGENSQKSWHLLGGSQCWATLWTGLGLLPSRLLPFSLQVGGVCVCVHVCLLQS